MSIDDNDSFLFMLPLYGYLIEPGPHPGFLRDPGKGTTFVPLWTDHDLFDTYLQKSGLAGKVSGLQIHSQEELVTFLLSIPANVQHVVVDPNPKEKQGLTVFEIRELLANLTS